MKQLTNFLFPALLILVGGILLIMGASQGQNIWVLLGSTAILLTGIVMVLLQVGMITRSVGFAIGVLFAIGAMGLAYRDYRSVQEVIEFNALKKTYDTKLIQGLKDVRTAQVEYRKVFGKYANNPDSLRLFVKSGKIPLVRAIGQRPDTLTVEEAIEMKIIVRDTIEVSALDSLFMNERAMEDRVFPFDPNSFTNSPVSGKPYIMKTGAINSSGRDVPVFVVKDPTPMVKGDTLMVGSLEKASTSGNWSGE